MRQIHAAVILLVVFILVGCSSATPMHPDPEVIQAAVKPGDKVYIQTRNDSGWHTVTKVTDSYLILGDEEVLYTDIKKMEKLEAPDITNDESKVVARIGIGLLVCYLVIGSIVGF